MNECGLDFAKRITCKLTGGKQNTCLTLRSLDETIATIDRWLKMTGCRIVECKQLRTNDKKSNNPLPHNTEKSVALVYSKLEIKKNIPIKGKPIITITVDDFKSF